MGLEDRLKQLESKVSSRNILLEHSFDPDECIAHLGLDPAAVRESSHTIGKSVVEIICGMIGIEPREFVRLLKEKVNLAR